jgi:ElaA protein
VVHVALTRDLDVATLYDILRLRSEVFVVEQACAYQDLDGRDLEADCRQLWCADDSGRVVATARLLVEPEGHRIGRVCTASEGRGRGLAATLVQAALREVGAGRVVLSAQSHLTGWYERFGFSSTGREWVEDGIPHTGMERAAIGSGAARSPGQSTGCTT